MAKRRKRKGLRIRLKKTFPFISLGGAKKSCVQQLKRVSYNLDRAIEQADNRGYTAMVHSKGSFFDDPRVKSLMRKYDALLKRCSYLGPVKR